ncbi:hypothetical protein [Mesorhizobium sp. M1396]|uniref:hypothetical protein n=1 Tax=Mesorhizobium sp. M1396 TaxID=2957095 RepID=UPI0033395FBC
MTDNVTSWKQYFGQNRAKAGALMRSSSRQRLSTDSADCADPNACEISEPAGE